MQLADRWIDDADLADAIRRGGRVVFYEWCISCIIFTLRRPSGLILLRFREYGLVRGLPYTLLSLLLGWWGLPWGFVYTPLVLLTNLCGGCDVTTHVCAQLRLTDDELCEP